MNKPSDEEFKPSDEELEWLKRRFPCFKRFVENSINEMIAELEDYKAQMFGGHSTTWGMNFSPKNGEIHHFDKGEPMYRQLHLRNLAKMATSLADFLDKYSTITDTMKTMRVVNRDKR